jgi:uncharacterized cofD-like protein
LSRDYLSKWLYVGLHVKRWLVLLVIAIAIMGLGFSFIIREAYVTAYVATDVPEWVYYSTLWFLPRWARGLVLLTGATLLTVMAGWKLNKSLARALLPSADDREIIDVIYQNRTRGRGPKVVAIGGGTGLSNLLRGLKQYTANLTAIVTVADDGGSSGRLRRDLHVIPPGDIRNCIAALADAEPLMTDLFQYRFDERHGEGFSGHSFGNLFITAMAEVTGNMETAVSETSRVLAVRGQIVPASLEDVTLVARWADGAVERGESRLPDRGEPPAEVWIEPRNVSAHPKAVRAILEADLIVIGPGSLYTSVLPNLLVRDIEKAMQEARGHKVFISNVATQSGETDGYTAADHLAALRRHLHRDDIADVVLANSNIPQEPLPAEWHSTPVLAPGDADYGTARLVLSDLVDAEHRHQHNTERLAAAIMRAYFERDLRVQAPAAFAAAE